MGPWSGCGRAVAPCATEGPIGPTPPLWAYRSHTPSPPTPWAHRSHTLAALSVVALCLSGCRNQPQRSDAALIAETNRAVGLMGQFDFARARDAFATLAASHPERPELHVNLAVATLNRQQEGDAAAAQQILRRVLAGDPQN